MVGPQTLDILEMFGALGLFGGGFLCVAASPLVLRDWVAWRRPHRAWVRYLAERRLEGRARFTLSRRWTLSGTIEGIPVTAISKRTSTIVRADAMLDRSIRITRVSILHGGSLYVGDPMLDGEYAFDGPPLAIAAALDEPARVALHEAYERGVRLHDGRASFSADRRLRGSEAIGPIVESVVALARIFAPRPDDELRASAARIATSDPLYDVRCQALLALARAAPDSEELAAAARGVRGVDPTDAGMKGRVRFRRRDLSAIGTARHGTLAEVRALLGEVSPPVESLLLERIRRDAPADAERILVDRLARAEGEAKVTAARLLGEIGGREAVAPLHAAAPGILGETDLRRAITAALAAVKSRLGDVAPGELALADETADAGAVSLADERGALSVARKQPGGAGSKN